MSLKRKSRVKSVKDLQDLSARAPPTKNHLASVYAVALSFRFGLIGFASRSRRELAVDGAT